MGSVGKVWILIQLSLFAAVLLGTVLSFLRKKYDPLGYLLSGIDIYYLLFSPPFIIIIALAQPNFLIYTLAVGSLWILQLWYSLTLITRINPYADGVIAFIAPVMIWIFLLPIGIVIRLIWG